MTEPTAGLGNHEPALRTIELVCERLGELGLPVGPDTARELVQAILSSEAPRVDARIREALQTSLETIRVAAQSAIGVLGSTAAVESRIPQEAPKAVLDPVPRRAAPPAPSTATPKPAPRPRPTPKRPADGDDLDGEHRPVFRRPRGR
jgi:hypothetical protein